MDLPIRMGNIYNMKHCHAIILKFGEKFSTSKTKLVLEVKACIRSTIKEILPLYCRKFSVFLFALII